MQRGLEDGISRLREGATFLTSELRLVAPSTLPCRAAGRGWVPRVPRQAAPVTSATITQRLPRFTDTRPPPRTGAQGLDRASMRSRLFPRARSLLLSPDSDSEGHASGHYCFPCETAARPRRRRTAAMRDLQGSPTVAASCWNERQASAIPWRQLVIAMRDERARAIVVRLIALAV